MTAEGVDLFDDKAVVIVRNNAELLIMEPDPKGKILHCITNADNGTAFLFSIGLTPKSLTELHDNSTRGNFNWTINDGSLEVSGKTNTWQLCFTNLQNGIKANVWLSEEDTLALQNALFIEMQ
jgi:hypothetical protein